MLGPVTKNDISVKVTPIISRAPTSNASSRCPTHDGTTNNGPVDIISKWSIGWQTPTLMISCYVLALLSSATHLTLFKIVHSREASGPNQVIPQTYVTTLSTVLSNTFGFALRTSLAVSFCQYMWYMLRESTMKVSTIELLFTIRTNFFMLFHAAVIRAAPILCVLAAFMWSLQIATSFPPGALTVTTAVKESYETISVPTFDATFMGNGSGVEANLYSLANLFVADTGGGFVALAGQQGTKHRSLLPRIAFPVLVKGEAFESPSPCGLNCSYSIAFEGPSFTCTNRTSMFRNSTGTDLWEIYNGQWFDHRGVFFAPDQASVTKYSGSHFNTTTLSPLEKNTTSKDILIRKQDLTCLPQRSRFVVNTKFVNNVQSRSIKSEPIERLVSLEPRTRGGMVIVPGFSSRQGYGYGTEPAEWNEAALNFYRDINHMTIIGSMLNKLVGNVLADSVVPADIIRIDGGNGPVIKPGEPAQQSSEIVKDVVWGQRRFQADSDVCPGVNNSIIDSTRFNVNFAAYTSRQAANPDIVITEQLLNEYLLNLTLSMMTAFNTWNTSANATKQTTVSVYDFSSPLNLIVPYSVSLLLALPFLLLGFWALWKNGVSAIDSSFLQILMTTTGSAVLDRAAAGGCLGGDESVPGELKDMRIKFGEIIVGKSHGQVRRAAFGTEEEVTTLSKNNVYGIARWI